MSPWFGDLTKRFSEAGNPQHLLDSKWRVARAFWNNAFAITAFEFVGSFVIDKLTAAAFRATNRFLGIVFHVGDFIPKPDS